MNLTVRIHDKEYIKEVAQGITFTEEYNETLDSGVVRLSHVKGQILGLKPYDDVYIYESAPEGEDNVKWFNDHMALWIEGGKLHDGDEIDKLSGKRIPFYRHLLVDKFSEDIINLSENIYSYTIELFSETKGLETVQIPNVSVTQPINISKKIDIYTYLTRFVNFYSPKIKMIKRDDITEWEYVPKYTVAPELKSIFGGFYSQDFTLSNPNLRDVLSSLMITLDMIPYVKDNAIYAKAISERTGKYKIDEEQESGRISRIVGQMNSSDFCDGVRRQYSDALSQDGICNFVEYLGFRTSDNPLMTLDNMRIETSHSIYRVDKLYLCYYRLVNIRERAATSNTFDPVVDPSAYVFCKQDITPLVKLTEEWNMLKQDWRELQAPTSINDLAQFKISTVHYSIGGKTIEGWGTRYQTYQANAIQAYDITKTYIENIMNLTGRMNQFGTISQEDFQKDYIDSNNLPNDYFLSHYIDVPSSNPVIYAPGDLVSTAQKYKALFFEIQYSGFYNGALIHTRDTGVDNIYQNDNVSSSLTLLEKDGSSQKEKLNRFSNKTHVMNGRLSGANYGIQNLLRLGNTGKIGADDDVIIYRREYSIFNNYILASYAGIQDYVLKNFYTSVYAKYRTNQLMSYGESTSRAENKKVLLLLSKNKKYKDEKTFFEISNDIVKTTQKITFNNNAVPNVTEESLNSKIEQLESFSDIYQPHNLIIGARYYYVAYCTDKEKNANCFVQIMSIEGTVVKAKLIDWLFADASSIRRTETQELFSAFSPSATERFINTAIISTGNNKKFFVEANTFTSGNSLCFNASMSDNASGGTYIDKYSTQYQTLIQNPSDDKNYYIGTTLDWYDVVDDDETGAISNMRFDFSHRSVGSATKKTVSRAQASWLPSFFGYLKVLPKCENDIFEDTEMNKFNVDMQGVSKDNKERIDLTIQIEPIVDGTKTPDVIVGNKMLGLSDLLNREIKTPSNKNIEETGQQKRVGSTLSIKASTQNQFLYIETLDNDDILQILQYIWEQRTTYNDPTFTLSCTLNGDINIYKKDNKDKEFFRFSALGIDYFWLDQFGDIREDQSAKPELVDQQIVLVLRGKGEYKIAGNSAPTILNELRLIYQNSGNVMSFWNWWQCEANIAVTGGGKIELDGTPRGITVANAYEIWTKKKSVIYNNMFVEFRQSNIEKTIIYNILPSNTNKSRFSSYRPFEIFETIGGGEDSIIRINLSNAPQGTKSVIYWYFDFKSAYSQDYTGDNYAYIYSPEKSGYYFVFGANITDTDIARGYVDIYVSKLTNRDTRVFDSVWKQVGIVHNCINKNGEYVPTNKHTYDKIFDSGEVNNFNIEEYKDGKFTSKNVNYYVGEQVLLQYEGKQFEAWVIGEKVIKKNPYRLLVEQGQEDVRLKVSLLPPVLKACQSAMVDDKQYVEFTINNPNQVKGLSIEGQVIAEGDQYDLFEVTNVQISASDLTFEVQVRSDINLRDGFDITMRFKANDISVSPWTTSI